MKQNLSSILIALCSAIILTVTACSLSNSNSSGSNKNITKTDTSKIDLSQYQYQREMCQKITEIEVVDCQQQGGNLQRAGLMGCYTCIVEYADGGKTCSDSSECQGDCLNYDDFIPTDKINQTGQCAKDNSPFGCYQVIEKGVAKSAMCVD